MSLLESLQALRPDLARAAQEVIDAWQQDEDGEDDELGHGGACDAVAEAMWGVIANALPDVTVTEGGHDGDDHAWLIVYDDVDAFGVDVPPGVYETGGGYSWTKIPGATVEEDDVSIFKVRRDDVVDGRDVQASLRRIASRLASQQDQDDEDPEWSYQVTFLRNLDSISSEGLRPGAGGGLGVNAYKGWSQGKLFFSGPGSLLHWFSRLEDHARDRSDNPYEDGLVPVVMRFPTPEGGTADEVAAKDGISAQDSYWVQGEIGPDEIEVWDGSSWVHVSDWESIDGSQSFDVETDTDYETGEEVEYRDFKSSNPLLPPV